MRKYSRIPMAALMVLAAACAKNEEDVVLGQNQEVVPASDAVCIHAVGGESNDPAVKSEIDGTSGAFTWSAGDQIAVYSSTAGYKKSDALTADTGAGSNAATFYFSGSNTFDLSTRADVAVFPASLVFDGTAVRQASADDHTVGAGGKLTITLPGSYKFSACRNNTIATPMVAVNTPGGSLAFKSICALVRITVKNIPKDTHTIRISFPGKKVCGEFTINNLAVGTDGLLLSDSEAEGDDTIIITDLYVSAFNSSGLELNVPVPVGVAGDQEYLYVRAAAYDYFQNETTSEVFEHKINSIDTPLKVVESVPTAWAPGRLAAKKVTANLPYFTSNSKSAPYNKKVVFAPGNLRATTTKLPASTTNPIGEAENWRFADHQYDALGNCAENRFEVKGEIDLFAYIAQSAEQEYEVNQYGILYPAASPINTFAGNAQEDLLRCNWGENLNGVSYAPNTWRATNNLKEGGESAAEFARILTRSTTSGYVAAKAAIIKQPGDTIRGLIIFPDVYSHPYGVSEILYHGRVDKTITNSPPGSKNAHWLDNKISLAEWDILENVGGCVFLPVGALRDRIKASDNKYYVNTEKYFGELAYWTGYGTTISGTSNANVAAVIVSDKDYCAYSKIKDGSTDIAPAKSVNRTCGASVRLIRDVN